MAKGRAKKEKEENIFQALALLEEEMHIPVDYMIEKITSAIRIALKKSNNGNDDIMIRIDPESKVFSVFIHKKVVEQVTDPGREVLLDVALQNDPLAEIGETVAIKQDPKQFGRIAAQTAKHIIHQGIRDVEKGQAEKEIQSRIQELVTATVERVNPETGDVIVKIGNNTMVLTRKEQVENETYTVGDLIKVYVVEIRSGDREPRTTISRTHPGMVKRLFEMEVPEISDGTVEIKSVSREPGSRTKIAVWSNDENVDPVGACIGPRGSRVSKIVEELGGEKIDIIKYSEDITEFIAKALSPADVTSVVILDEAAKSCYATVPGSQLSLAIGNKGQNVRLAVKLTGWKIDVRSEEDVRAAEEEAAQAAEDEYDEAYEDDVEDGLTEEDETPSQEELSENTADGDESADSDGAE
ncbi:MAG: transcription termination/antitermination protein NusA [Clostridia bacterium]|nr:transcription termination/antitermination protein NusA [Clostridia bacterium]MBQ1554269.1 transcription termination/antitermination protein NusA [Clostridia bacterium]MBQ4396529.1 transcription termination/antitermination protein NusA [Clostridia bacterium]